MTLKYFLELEVTGDPADVREAIDRALDEGVLQNALFLETPPARSRS